MSALTKEQIAALPVLVADATPGPWRVEQGTTLIWGHCNPDDASNRGMGYPVSECRITPISSWAKGPDADEGEGNASLIALAPSLAATVIEQQAEIERLREALGWYTNPAIYAPHPHGPAFDRRDVSYVARAALEGKT